MKQLLFLLLFPCLCVAQYTGNAGQKITLGEQTTADGLVYRGVASIDTVTATSKITRANKQDTSAFILLDTVTNLLWHYKIGINAWIQAGGGVSVTSFSAGTTGLTPSTATTGAVTLGGTLAVANGGTGASVRTFVDTINTQSVNGEKTFTGITKITNTTNSTSTTTGALTISGGLGINNTLYGKNAFFEGVFTATGPATGTAFFLKKTGNIDVFAININDNDTWTMFDNFGSGLSYNEGITQKNGNLGIKTQDPTQALHVVGNARISGLANAANPVAVEVDANGVLVRTSSINIKEDVQNLPYGLNEVLLLQPSKFSYIDKYKYGEGYDIGFIAEDVNDVIPEAVGTGVDSEVFMDKSKLIPVLVKAIQEQQTLIKSLEQRILILENK